MSEYFIGIEDHYAWANLVSVAMSGAGDVLLDKRRVELLDQRLAVSPYHHDTLRMRDLKAFGRTRGPWAASSALQRPTIAAFGNLPNAA
ncbi:MAG: hypothetical protein ACREPM_18180 [Gemmatimonadaceae bacterium]